MASSISKAASDLVETGRAIFVEALAACSVEHAFAAKVSSRGADVLELASGERVDLAAVKRVVVIAIGKGAASMLEGLLRLRVVTEGREVRGVLVAPKRPENLPAGFAYFAGGHPSPNEESFAAARAALELLRGNSASRTAALETFYFFLISGGASAMFELPLDPAITLEETVAFYRVLVHSGAPIGEINCVRKHFSLVKGGRLALPAGVLRSITLAVSDVPAGQLDALSSGPTLPDSSTIDQCREILERYALLEQMPMTVRRFFEGPLFVETPKPGGITARVYPLLSSDDLANAACAVAERRGFRCFIDNTCDDWEYSAAADYLLAKLEGLRREHGRVCLVSAGEVTVRVPSEITPGRGGRNQHLALYGALRLPLGVALLSAGSDGIDGASLAAGAIVDARTVRGREREARAALKNFDSFTFLDAVGATVTTGSTGNNLRDLRLLLADAVEEKSTSAA